MDDQVPMTILQLAAPAQAGGLESVLLDLAGGLRSRGVRVVVGAILDAPGAADAVPRRAEARGLDVVRVVVPHRAYLREYRAIATLIGEVRPDVVHTHGYRADLLGGLAARRTGVPWISTAHGFTGGGARARLYEWLQVRSFRGAARVIAVSRPVRQRLEREGVPGGNIELLANAWAPTTRLDRTEARRRLGIGADELVVGWVGRLTPEKGADVFLEALARLRDLPWTASVVGDGSDRLILERQAGALGIGDRVRWHGLVPEAASLYGAFDAWVLSSHTEGTPIALFEAMAAGIPIVVTAVGGVPDVVSPAEALLVPPDRPEELAAALRTILLERPSAAQRVDAASRRLLQRFAVEPWLDAHLSLYRAALTKS